jgi:hypothetical protein
VRIGRSLVRRLAGLLAAITIASGVAVVAQAPAASAAGCHWKVVWSVAGVYEEPSSYPFFGPVKDKHAGDIVGEYCVIAFSPANGLNWVAVATSAAADGVGWMRLDALVAV